MGDIVACEPVARQVRKDNPGAFIVWCIQQNYAELMRHHPAVDHVLPVKCLTEWMLFADSPLFDQIIDLEMDRKPCKECRLALEKKSDFGVTYENYYRLGTLLEVYLRCADFRVEDKSPQLFIPDALKDKIEDLLGSGAMFVTVHCSSNEDCRDWRIEKWGELLHWLTTHWPVQIVEVGLKPVLNGLQLPRYRPLCGELSILETAEVMRRSILFIGVDSGPAHLANAAGTKGVVLIGKYAGFTNYQPYNGNFANEEFASLVYSDEAAAKIDVQAVQRAVEAKLSPVFDTGTTIPRPLANIHSARA